MTPAPSRNPFGNRRRAGMLISLLAGLLCSGGIGSVLGQPTPPGRAASKPVAEQGVRWNDLKPAQQSTLRPLEREWSVISSSHKQKWLELATRFPKMTQPEQIRVQERMAEWAKLTPQQRSDARMNFQEAKQLPAQDRNARWNAYQALSPEQKRELAARAAQASPATAIDTARKVSEPGPRSDKPALRESSQAKSNIVPNPGLAAPPKAIGPGVVQAQPGATTTLITKRPTPPTHQQTGLPKIAATPEFVNKATLQPQRGPQGAATRSAATGASGSASKQ